MPVVTEAEPTPVADFENSGNLLSGVVHRVLGGVAHAEAGARRSGDHA
ncbi:hypothetical protein ACQP1K_18330 [Sphaerimonospora sp. CA-214678]